MDLRDGPEEAAFRATLRTWLEANVPSGLRGFRGWTGPALALGRDWSKRLAEAGYAGLTWPKEYGGAGLPWRYQALYLEELARAEAPQHLGVIGLGMAGPTIIAHGRPDQKTPRTSGARASPSPAQAPTSRPCARVWIWSAIGSW